MLALVTKLAIAMMTSPSAITGPAPAPRVRLISGPAAGAVCATLMTVAAGDRAVLSRIWGWTRDHLQLADGLFALHASPAGQVVSREPASDADLLIAWALLRYRGPSAAAWHQAGHRMASAILAHEVTAGPGAAPVLTAGPWATGRPASLDLSYWSLAAFDGLARFTGDQAWHCLAVGAVTMTRELTGDGRLLPPDWAELTASGALRPEPAPDGSQPQTQCGPDAQRTVAWFAASCDPQARALAARWWPLLRSGDRAQTLALRPDGTVLNPTPPCCRWSRQPPRPTHRATARRRAGCCSGRRPSNRPIRPTTGAPGPRSDRRCSAPPPSALAEHMRPALRPGRDMVLALDRVQQPRYMPLPDRFGAEKDILMTNEKRHTLSEPEPPDNAEAVKHIPGLIPRTPGTIFRALLGVLLFFCGILLGVWLIIRFRRDT